MKIVKDFFSRDISNIYSICGIIEDIFLKYTFIINSIL